MGQSVLSDVPMTVPLQTQGESSRQVSQTVTAPVQSGNLAACSRSRLGAPADAERTGFVIRPLGRHRRQSPSGGWGEREGSCCGLRPPSFSYCWCARCHPARRRQRVRRTVRSARPVRPPSSWANSPSLPGIRSAASTPELSTPAALRICSENNLSPDREYGWFCTGVRSRSPDMSAAINGPIGSRGGLGEFAVQGPPALRAEVRYQGHVGSSPHPQDDLAITERRVRRDETSFCQDDEQYNAP